MNGQKERDLISGISLRNKFFVNLKNYGLIEKFQEDKSRLRKSALNIAKDEAIRANTPTNFTSKPASTETSRPKSSLSTAPSNSGQKVSKMNERKKEVKFL